MLTHKFRRAALTVSAVAAALAVSSAPAGAACVTAGAAVRVLTISATPVRHGTCIVPTPLPAWRSDHVYVDTSAAGIDISVGTVSP